MVTLAQYYDMLEAHDWYFDWSDDGSVWRRGQANVDKLVAIAEQSPEYEQLFMAYREHMFTGEPWDSPRAPKPDRPEETNE